MRRSAIAIFLAFAACGGDRQTNVTARGGPTHFAGVSASFGLGPATVVTPDGGFPATLFLLSILEVPDPCEPPDAGTASGRIQSLDSQLGKIGTNSITAGRYTLGTSFMPSQLLVSFLAERGGQVVQADAATSGWLELTTLTASEADGSIDVGFFDGTRISGDFFARTCAQLQR